MHYGLGLYRCYMWISSSCRFDTGKAPMLIDCSKKCLPQIYLAALPPWLGSQGSFAPPVVFGDEGDLVLWDFGDCTPSCASCSRKLDHKSASDSFLLLLSRKRSVDRDGVLGVRCQGDSGTLRLRFDVPGLARPACSRCSSQVSGWGSLCFANLTHRLTRPAKLL